MFRVQIFQIISNVKRVRMISSKPLPENEKTTDISITSSFRKDIEISINKWRNSVTKIPVVINGNEITTPSTGCHFMPSDHSVKIAEFSLASSENIKDAIDGALKAKKAWERLSTKERCSVFSKAAYLISTKYRADVLATTMLGQGKNHFQADIDAICETIDFLNFNVHYAKCLESDELQLRQSPGVINSVKYRPLEGFIAAITPFNFTAIGGNLPTAPAMLGNTVLWKPSSTAILSNWLIYKILLESGLPPGVIQFLPSDGPTFGSVICESEHLAAITFTGSTSTFNHLNSEVGKRIASYRTYPRLMGECGGKNFHLIHETANIKSSVNCTLRAAFEYSGQKCSACSRLYVPDTIWPEFKEYMLSQVKKIKVGQPFEYDTFLSAVIDERSFNKIKSYVDMAKNDEELSILSGGDYSDEKGYFITPTIVQTTNMNHRIINEEIFGPVLTVYVYKSEEWSSFVPKLADSSCYGLTGAIFCNDTYSTKFAEDTLLHSAGNIYINDKSTGAVVGQQPFGGARKSGTNDKAGMYSYLLRFVSPQARKETFTYYDDILYDYMKN